MSKLKKAMQRMKALRESEKTSGGRVLSDREQLEYDINRLLSDEDPEILRSKQKQIKLSYSKTTTIKTDPEILKDNRVFALRHEMEVAEQIELLRFQVLKKLKQINANSLMITSAKHREGKTFISTNLAVSLSQNLNRTVMLVDTDLRKRTYTHYDLSNVFFNSSTRPGLSDFLLGEKQIEDILINPGIPRLTILPGGKPLPDSSTHLGSAKMEVLVNEMKTRYSKERILIFDCSSSFSSADPLILSKMVDAVLLVVESENTETKSFLRMIELLDDKKIIGAVMNKAR